ncbi:SRPBCC family protein [Pendulispora albinea]|uniref:SRPBCC family protein n=1 Tax=Pendulispora albinea TaxID=2741071 RepID=A0ABZ2LVY7_9BACT
MFRKILLGLAAVAVVFVLVVSTRPSTFHVERSVTVAAPAERAFAQVNDFHEWTGWSPYEKLDPQLRRTYEGAPAGVGAIYAWAGNGKAGEGRMTIEASDAPSRIAINLEFIEPFAATDTATFTFVPTAEGTKVTWAIDGTNNFVSKAFSLFMDMDKLIGGDFEAGLASLKAIAERETAQVAR